MNEEVRRILEQIFTPVNAPPGNMYQAYLMNRASSPRGSGLDSFALEEHSRASAQAANQLEQQKAQAAALGDLEKARINNRMELAKALIGKLPTLPLDLKMKVDPDLPAGFEFDEEQAKRYGVLGRQQQRADILLDAANAAQAARSGGLYTPPEIISNLLSEREEPVPPMQPLTDANMTPAERTARINATRPVVVGGGGATAPVEVEDPYDKIRVSTPEGISGKARDVANVIGISPEALIGTMRLPELVRNFRGRTINGQIVADIRPIANPRTGSPTQYVLMNRNGQFIARVDINGRMLP